MLKLKNNTIVPVLTLALALLVWTGGATEEAPTDERLKAITVELEKMRLDFQHANERIDILEKSLSATERQAADLQRQNLDLQEGRDMAHEDVELMRTEMQRCAGDRAHLDDLAIRYQASQAQLHELRQHLHESETLLETTTKERENLQSHYDWIKARLNTVLQETTRLNTQHNQSGQNVESSRSDQRQ